MLGKIEGTRRRGQRRIRWLDGTTNTMNRRLSKLWEIVKDREALCAAAHGITKSDTTEEQQQAALSSCIHNTSSESLGLRFHLGF